MRAIYYPDLSPSVDSLVVENEKFHHLINVCRFKIEDKILLLSGHGEQFESTIIEVNKKNAVLKIHHYQYIQKEKIKRRALIAIPKKEALESMLRASTEMGMDEIYLIRSDFSVESLPSEQRILKVIIPALEQSNNPWLPKIYFIKSWNDFNNWGENCYVLHSGNLQTNLKSYEISDFTVFVGPEGGWSEREVNLFNDKKCNSIKFKTPIMRAPTALIYGMGYLNRLLIS
jgi:16S rRNA (uracil1498-N3)-methyltransferase